MNDIKIRIGNVNVWYGSNHALKDVSLDIPRNAITAFIGPSGCGKTTLLRSINRLNDLVRGFRLEGRVEVDGEDVYESNATRYICDLRKNIGMVFQSPNILPKSILDNLILPLKEHKRMKRGLMVERAIEILKQCAIHDEVADKLSKSALRLSGGQQQRICITRALMLEPGIILFDEPCSALDPISTAKIEDMLMILKQKHTIVIVTHNIGQAGRIADNTAFFYRGEVVEWGPTSELFIRPKTQLLQKYLKGEF